MLDLNNLVNNYLIKVNQNKNKKPIFKSNKTNIDNILTSIKGIELIKSFEGFEKNIYKDIVGYETIGYGHLIKKNEKNKFLNGINKKQGHKLLIDDIKKFEMYVKKYVNVTLNINQFSALVSFCYNLGPGALKCSTLLKKINRGEFKSAANEFERWIYAGGVKINGLLRRRRAEKKLFMAKCDE